MNTYTPSVFEVMIPPLGHWNRLGRDGLRLVTHLNSPKPFAVRVQHGCGFAHNAIVLTRVKNNRKGATVAAHAQLF